MTVQSSHCEPDQMVLLIEDRLSSDEIVRMEQHLEQCDSCRGNFDRLVGDERWLKAVRRHLGDEPGEPVEVAAQASETLEFLTPSDWPDSLGRLGTYEIKGYLGRGGMGVVLKAFDPALRRNVAIKVLSTALASSGSARQRFLREARAAAAVVHPHVVGVYAVEPAGQPFLVMEYVPGRSLQERLDKLGPLGLAEILRIGMQTADGLAAAHAQGLVHRDVKPANILLEDAVERVRLTDFGLARAAAEAAVTRSGVVAGTPHYMAPEQALGKAADQRADLFSLGSTLYAMCAGHPPFRADSPLAVLKRVCDEEPRPLLEVNADVPKWLAAIVAKLMHKDPAQRFQTAQDVSSLLQRCLAHVQQPNVVPLPADPVFQEQRTRRHRVGRKPALVAVAILVLGASTLLWWHIGKVRIEQEGEPDSPPGQHDRGSDWLLGADDVAGKIQAAQKQAAALEGSLIHTETSERDSLSDAIRQLRQRVSALEREVAPSLSITTEPPAYRPYPTPNERK
ncbi:serine/threonine-protein kinase [soil metagenome]